MSGFYQIRVSSPVRWPAIESRPLPWWRRAIRYIASAPAGWWHGISTALYNWRVRAYYARTRIRVQKCDDCGRLNESLAMVVIGYSDGSDGEVCPDCRMWGPVK